MNKSQTNDYTTDEIVILSNYICLNIFRTYLIAIYVNDKGIVQVILCNCKLLSAYISTLDNKLKVNSSGINIQQSLGDNVLLCGICNFLLRKWQVADLPLPNVGLGRDA